MPAGEVNIAKRFLRRVKATIVTLAILIGILIVHEAAVCYLVGIKYINGLRFVVTDQNFVMPEGPTLFILRKLTKDMIGKKIHAASGNAGIDMERIPGKTVKDIRTWGKQYFISLKDVHIRIHFLMFGSSSINEQVRPDKSVRLKLTFKNKTLYFYTCAVKLLEEIENVFDWKADVMSDLWDPKGARKKLKAAPEMMVCDALLDQQIFSGVGNIIKNEVLYRIRVHPESPIGDLPPKKLSELITEARKYSFDFLNWKEQYVLRKHWLAHTKRTCMRCAIPLVKKYCGKTQRRTFFCEKCQVMYGKAPGEPGSKIVKARKNPI